jgi:hypothetical protein
MQYSSPSLMLLSAKCPQVVYCQHACPFTCFPALGVGPDGSQLLPSCLHVLKFQRHEALSITVKNFTKYLLSDWYASCPVLEMGRQNGVVPPLKAGAGGQLHNRLAHSLRAQRGRITDWESAVFPDRLRLHVWARPADKQGFWGKWTVGCSLGGHKSGHKGIEAWGDPGSHMHLPFPRSESPREEWRAQLCTFRLGSDQKWVPSLLLRRPSKGLERMQYSRAGVARWGEQWGDFKRRADVRS